MCLLRITVIPLLLALLLLALPAAPQSSKSMAPLVPRPQATTPAAAAVYRTQASLVLVDVVVSEKGKPVEGLPSNRFHLFENGKEQRLVVFEEHRSGDTPQIGKVPELPLGVYSNYPRFAVTSAANVLLLDAPCPTRVTSAGRWSIICIAFRPAPASPSLRWHRACE